MIIAYLRVSREDLSTENQKQAITARYKVDRFFVDPDTSGAIPARQRPQLGELLQFARQGDTIIVTAIDRLGRNTSDVLSTVEHFLSREVEVVSLREGIDFSTAMGKVVLTIMAALAELERANTIERTITGLHRAKAQGKVLGRPFTYDHAALAEYALSHSIHATALHFGCDRATVRRAIKAHA